MNIGLYLHVPFCEQRCIYCDFYSTTEGVQVKALYVKALCKELIARKSETSGHDLTTLYWGGGTPSQLSNSALSEIFQTIRLHYGIATNAEITFEANPDDITAEKALFLKELGVNRVSLGVQTFQDELLRLLRRRHTSSQIAKSVHTLQSAGITNLSIDLIYGLPQQSEAKWRNDLDQALTLPITHLSAYALSYEVGTQLERMRTNGKIEETDDLTSSRMYEYLLDRTAAAGFQHYEISSFSLPQMQAQHNSSYWNGTPYIGCGPGAHSFNGSCRRSNLSNLQNYNQSEGYPPFEQENLSMEERYNETVFTALRTCNGLSLSDVVRRFGKEKLYYLRRMAKRSLSNGLLHETKGHLQLTRKGLFVSDSVISDLLIV